MIQRSLKAQKTVRLLVWLLAVIGLVAGTPGLAQSGRGTLTGSVKDSTGAVVSGASLDLTASTTGSHRVAISSAEGLFTFPELAPGIYSLSVT
jgi:hypothetical protein